MSASVSPTTNRPYGVQRVCAAWDLPRSSCYAAWTDDRSPAAPAGKRGPTPALTDAALLALIRADLVASPFQGEGHRKVWARLKILQGIRTGRKRVLRIMREHQLLSPHRQRQGADRLHDGTIVTDAPGIMWGTDGARAFTLDQGAGAGSSWRLSTGMPSVWAGTSARPAAATPRWSRSRPA
jgi:hypothetical protein